MCQRCNGLRALLNHCWGAVACVKAVARDTDRKPHEIVKRWCFPAQISPVSPPQPRDPDAERWAPSAADAGRAKHRNAAAIQLGMVVNKVGAHEFVFPADTAAARVWNLATLGKGGYRGPTPSDHV